jgi:hypothetical protein
MTPINPGNAVRWSSPTSPEASTPGEWCDAVGPALTWQGAPSSGAHDELVVATWNVHVGGGDLPGFVRDLRSGALTGRPVDAFVLLVQEAYRSGEQVPWPSAAERLTSRIDVGPPSGERIDVLEVAQRLGLHAFYVPSMPNGIGEGGESAPEDRGNAILSTLALTELSAIELPFEVQRRVAVAVTVSGVRADGTSWRLRVASGHLDTRSRLSRFLDSFGNGRARQASALGAWLADGDAALLGADLNTWSFGFLEDAVEILRARFPETPRGDEPTYTAAGVLGRRLDHLMLRLPPEYDADIQRVGHRYGSDHHPLVGVVRFAAAEGNAVAPRSTVARVTTPAR